MYPRSGGEKVYLEVVYKKPKFLATVIFAANAILLGFTAAGCIVSFHSANQWEIINLIWRSLLASKSFAQLSFFEVFTYPYSVFSSQQAKLQIAGSGEELL